MLHIVSAASLPGSPSVPNEDWFATGETYAVVLDGVTPPPGDGCIHGARWYAETLGAALVRGLETGTCALDLIVADAIREVTEAHKDTCDTTNPLTPGAQVAILREAGDRCDYLVLGDAALIWQEALGSIRVVCDNRVDLLPNPPAPVVLGGVRRYPNEYVATVRNQPGGFWVAAADPAAAAHALTGSFTTGDSVYAALCSDGLTRLVERFGWTWDEFLTAGFTHDVPSLIERVRNHEQAPKAEPAARGKSSDDATGVWIAFG
jgi:hypothetical protein